LSNVTPVRVNYLNNRELLTEIHRSKCSYCYFIDSIYVNYDAIVSSLDDITDQLIAETKAKRASQLMQKQKNDQKTAGLRLSQIKIKQINAEDIPLEDLVWRVMTFEHVPLDADRLKKPKNEAERHIKTNFPPFKHFIRKNDELIEVGRSHWINGLHNGEFSQEHGAINNRLAMMFMKLVDRYSQRSNWRGYCTDNMTEALTTHGWKGLDEISENDTILSYFEGDMKWSSVKSIYRGEFDGLMHKMTSRNFDSLVTPQHKFVTESGLVKAEYLHNSNNIILMGNSVNGNETERYSNSFVELIGWMITKGNYEFRDNKLRQIRIWQNEGEKADRIRNCVTDLNYKFSENKRSEKQVCFGLSRSDSKTIVERFPTKNLNMDFILSLTADQRELLINTMVDRDGYRTRSKEGRHFDQKSKEVMDMFIALCSLSGYRTMCRHIKMKSFDKTKDCYMYRTALLPSDSNTVAVRNINFHGGKVIGNQITKANKLNHPNEPTTYYKGMVWCPETEYGSFFARRNGTVYLTGNTYLSEMKGQALLQLSLVGLQFDESRSDNPFAYFTVCCANAFTRVLNLEKRNQNIRDDILIMNGAAPSITRQIDDEMKQKAASDALDNDDTESDIPPAPVAVTTKRGAFGRPISQPKSKPKNNQIDSGEMWEVGAKSTVRSSFKSIKR
jgi:hypothetical protein